MNDDTITVLTIAAILIAPSIFHYAWLIVEAAQEWLHHYREFHAFDNHRRTSWKW